MWELDGLKSGPLEVGELPGAPGDAGVGANRGWMDVVRPALRMKMEKYGGSGSDGSNIRFSLLAIVDDVYKKASDELELLKREHAALEKRMDSSGQVRDAALSALATPLGKTFAQDFGARKMDRDLAVMRLPDAELVPAWEACVRKVNTAKVMVEDELAKAIRSNVSASIRMWS